MAICFVSNRESRYLLVLTENYAALPIVQEELLKKGKDPVIIFGSSFPKDQEYTQVSTRIICSSALTKEKLWESYGKPWAIYGPYMGMVWKGRVVVWS